MTMIPLDQVKRRMPRLGTLRFGEQIDARNGGKRPTSIDVWRISSSDKTALTQVADLYGGTVELFDNDKANDEFVVRTESSELRVLLKPDVQVDTSYEKWGGGRCQRRCDGVTMTGYAYDDRGNKTAHEGLDCRCNRDGLKECKPRTRVSFLLPEIRLAGEWLLDTGSENALRELPGQVDIILQASGMGLTEASLRLESRQQDGGSKRFIVPVLGSMYSTDQMLNGAAQYTKRALPPGAEALPPGTDQWTSPYPEISGPVDVVEVVEPLGADMSSVDRLALDVNYDPSDIGRPF